VLQGQCDRYSGAELEQRPTKVDGFQTFRGTYCEDEDEPNNCPRDLLAALPAETVDRALSTTAFSGMSCSIQQLPPITVPEPTLIGPSSVAPAYITTSSPMLGWRADLLRLRTHSQNSTVAASAMADRKTIGHLS